jgi:hypothetical protein
MHYVRIFHNAARDEAGRNLGFFGYQAEHPMVLVFAYTTSSDTDGVAVEEAFEEFNIGEGPLAQAYRDRGLRSLSVGDVVAVDDRYHACAESGWARVYSPVALATPEQRRDPKRPDRWLFGSTPLDA